MTSLFYLGAFGVCLAEVELMVRLLKRTFLCSEWGGRVQETGRHHWCASESGSMFLLRPPPSPNLTISIQGVTLPKTNMDPENGTLKDCFPLQTSDFHGPCQFSAGYFQTDWIRVQFSAARNAEIANGRLAMMAIIGGSVAGESST